MDERLDPGCEGARALEARHRTQTTLLVGGPESQLGSIVRQTHDRQILAHVGSCGRCSSWRNALCADCGFDLRDAPHGWRCPQGPLSWRDYLPWNWRPRHAPSRPTLGASRPKPATTDGAHAAGERGEPPPRPASAHEARPPAARREPPRGAAVSPPAAKPSPSPLAMAYATLGLTSAATPEQVRKAFRERALQYHPDKVAHMAPEFKAVAEAKMKEINEAYERIKRTLAAA